MWVLDSIQPYPESVRWRIGWKESIEVTGLPFLNKGLKAPRPTCVLSPSPRWTISFHDFRANILSGLENTLPKTRSLHSTRDSELQKILWPRMQDGKDAVRIRQNEGQEKIKVESQKRECSMFK